MTMTKLSVVPAAAGSPPSDRAALVAAIEAAKAAKETLDKHNAAIGKLRKQNFQIVDRLKRAEVTITDARARHVTALAAAAVRDEAAPVSGVPAAQQAADDLRHELEANTDALNVLRQQTPDLEVASMQADADVEMEISRVLQPIASALIARRNALTAQLETVQDSLVQMLNSDAIAPADRDYRIKRTRLIDFVRPGLNEQRAPVSGAGPDWRAIRAALRADPGAPCRRSSNK
jgi:hypothetical protein